MRYLSLFILMCLLLPSCNRSSDTQLPLPREIGEVIFIDESFASLGNAGRVISQLVHLRDPMLVIESMGIHGTFDISVDFGAPQEQIAFADQGLAADTGRLEIPLVNHPGNATTWWKVELNLEGYEGHIFVSITGTVPLFPLSFP